MNLNINFKAGAVLACALVLSACGGGDGGESIQPGVTAESGVYLFGDITVRDTFTDVNDDGTQTVENFSFKPPGDLFYVEFNEEGTEFSVRDIDVTGLEDEDDTQVYTKQEDGSFVFERTLEGSGFESKTKITISALNSTGVISNFIEEEFKDGELIFIEETRTSVGSYTLVVKTTEEFFEDPTQYLDELMVDSEILTYVIDGAPVFYTNETDAFQELAFEITDVSIDSAPAEVQIDIGDLSTELDSLVLTTDSDDSANSFTVAPRQTIYISYENFVNTGDNSSEANATVSIEATVEELNLKAARSR